MAAAVRILIVLAGLFGAAGVALAAAAAHLPDAARLASASSMLLFHASAILATVLLCERAAWLQRIVGLVAACGFAAGVLLFAGDLTLRQFAGHGLFPMAAPSGGTLLIASWLVLAIAALWPRR